MKYAIEITKHAQRQLARLPPEPFERVDAAIRRLADRPRPAGAKKLVDRPAWRIRVGDYRVIYEIHDEALLVLVVDIGHRREVYR